MNYAIVELYTTKLLNTHTSDDAVKLTCNKESEYNSVRMAFRRYHSKLEEMKFIEKTRIIASKYLKEQKIGLFWLAINPQSISFEMDENGIYSAKQPREFKIISQAELESQLDATQRKHDSMLNLDENNDKPKTDEEFKKQWESMNPFKDAPIMTEEIAKQTLQVDGIDGGVEIEELNTEKPSLEGMFHINTTKTG